MDTKALFSFYPNAPFSLFFYLFIFFLSPTKKGQRDTPTRAPTVSRKQRDTPTRASPTKKGQRETPTRVAPGIPKPKTDISILGPQICYSRYHGRGRSHQAHKAVSTVLVPNSDSVPGWSTNYNRTATCQNTYQNTYHNAYHNTCHNADNNT